MARNDDRYWFDGCDWQCELEDGFECTRDGAGITTCVEICGAQTAGGAAVGN